MLATETMPTLEERENLMKGTCPKYTGFTPRPNEKLAVKHKPKSMLDIECNHFLRTSNEHFVHGHPNLGYKLWLEAGKYDSPFPPHPDPNFNSNIWRNFRKEYGFQTTAEGRRIGDIIATMYPLNIPAPSKVGSHTFDKYLRETKIFRNEKFQALAINRTKADVQDFKRLRIKSDARNPPLDEIGNILPPENMKKYEHRFIPVPPPPPTPPPLNQKIDSLGQKYVPRSEPLLWKLSYKLNHPSYEKVNEGIKKRRAIEEMVRHNHPDRSPLPQNFPSPIPQHFS